MRNSNCQGALVAEITQVLNFLVVFDGQVGGWTQVYVGLTFVTVRGAGHEVPLHEPRKAFTVFESFLEGKPMPFSPKLVDTL
jgi:serine carboxypeptidase-like clade 2